MGEFATLNYIVSGLLLLISLFLYKRRMKWARYKWWGFGFLQLFATVVLLHPTLLVVAYWRIIMDNQRILPYPYTVHDRISFYLFLFAVACSFGILVVIHINRILRKRLRKQRKNLSA